jgi:MoxR-like ATPase
MTNSEQYPDTNANTNWQLFFGNGEKNEAATQRLNALKAPPWRQFGDRSDVPLKKNEEGQDIDPRWEALQSLVKSKKRDISRGENFRIASEADSVINAVNAAIYLRRPLLVTGNPGSGKTSLAYALAYELGLGPVLSWAINARSTLQDGLYRYDAIARLQDTNFEKKSTQEGEQKQTEEQDIGEYIKLGSVGTAFLPSLLPRVLLIDEIDKSDINLPNDLLNLFEEGEFEIPELVRRSQNNKQNSETKTSFTIYTEDKDIKATISGGRVCCHAFPIIVMTSNGERDFPPAFKRRCLRVRMPDPNQKALQEIVKAHFGNDFLDDEKNKAKFQDLIQIFQPENKSAERATDQLLNAIYVLNHEVGTDEDSIKSIKDVLLRKLNIAD